MEKVKQGNLDERINDLDGIGNTAVLTAGLLVSGIRIVTLLDEVGHLAEGNELVTDNLVVGIESKTGNITFSHLEVTGTLLEGTVHRTNLGAETLTEVFKTGTNRKTVLGD